MNLDDVVMDLLLRVEALEKQVSKRAKSFIPPTLAEVQAYIEEKNAPVDAHSFFSFYQSKDWYIGKNRMKCWKSAVATWARKASPVAKPDSLSNRNAERIRQLGGNDGGG